MRTLQIASFFAITLVAATARAQDSGECTGGLCGAPEQSGGGCGCGCGCSILINFSDQGDTYQYADDYDDDSIEDDQDNCPFAFNPDQLDTDSDARGDGCDNCLQAANFDLRDSDADGDGDACDNDDDEDLVLDLNDDCVTVPNPDQSNDDNDFLGNACDADDDADGCDDAVDNCVLQASSDCLDSGAIFTGSCFDDFDADSIPDQIDLCPGVVSVGNGDGDEDGLGNECDFDLDNDGVDNTFDSCPNFPNLDQKDTDKDGLGDNCDPRLCFVIDQNNPADCLDPAGPFDISAGKTLKIKTGDDVLLHMFANREATSIRYTWSVVKAPKDGGNATIANPKGAVSVSKSIEYVYEKDREPRFHANVPGTYEIELLAELAFEDDAYPQQKTSKSKVTIEVGGSTINTFCAAAPGSVAPVAGLALMLAGLRRRRR